MIPDLPDDIVVKVFSTLSLFDLYFVRHICSAWRQCATRAKNRKCALRVSATCGGKLSTSPKVHPLVRGKQMYSKPMQPRTMGDGFLCVPEAGRHAVRISKISAHDGTLSIYDEVYPWMNPPFVQPRDVLHTRTADGFEVLYVITGEHVRRFFLAEYETAHPSTPTSRSAQAVATRVDQWYDGTFGELFYAYARVPPPDFDAPSFFKCSPSLDPPGPAYNQSNGLSCPKSMALDEEAEELYVADSHLNHPGSVEVLNARSLATTRGFAIQGDGSGIVNRTMPSSLCLHGGEVYVCTIAFVHVYSKHGTLLRVFSDGPRLHPLDGHVLPRGLAVYAIDGVDHMLVSTEKHVHVLTLDGRREPRQIVAVPGASILTGLCVHHGRIYVSDEQGNRIHVLEPCALSEEGGQQAGGGGAGPGP